MRAGWLPPRDCSTKPARLARGHSNLMAHTSTREEPRSSPGPVAPSVSAAAAAAAADDDAVARPEHDMVVAHPSGDHGHVLCGWSARAAVDAALGRRPDPGSASIDTGATITGLALGRIPDGSGSSAAEATLILHRAGAKTSVLPPITL